MKQVKFARTFRDRIDEATVHEYPAEWSGTVTNEVAERAQRAEVLEGSPRDAAPARRAAAPKPAAKSKAKADTPAPAAPAAPAQIED